MKKFTESVNNNIVKVKKETLIYFNLFDMLKGLEKERPGIEERIWDHMCEWGHLDSADAVYNGRISTINLFYYGVGDEYPILSKNEDKYPIADDIEHSKKIHPEAFVKGTKEEALRLDLNLIWHVYQDDLADEMSLYGSAVESFAVLVSW